MNRVQGELLIEKVIYLLNEYQEKNLKEIKSLKLDIQQLEKTIKQLKDVSLKAESLDSLISNIEVLTKELGVAYYKESDQRSLLSIPQVAKLLGITESAIRYRIRMGQITSPIFVNNRSYYPQERLQTIKDQLCSLSKN